MIPFKYQLASGDAFSENADAQYGELPDGQNPNTRKTDGGNVVAMSSSPHADHIRTPATISVWVNGDCERRQTECTGAINELIQDFGAACVIQGLMDTEASHAITKLGAGDQMKLARGVLREIQRAKNGALCADLIALAIGDGERVGFSLKEIGTYHGCTKQAASKQLIGLVERLGLPRLSFQLSDDARASYRALNRRNHAVAMTAGVAA